MPQVSIDQAVHAALEHHRAGRLAEAEGIYRQVLAHQPNHAEVLHLLGTMAQQLGRKDAASELLRRATEAAPSDARYYLKLAMALQGLRRLGNAAAAFSRAIQLDRGFFEAHLGLGIVQFEMGQVVEAIESHQRAIQIKPNAPEAHYNLGCILHSQKKIDEAIASYTRAIQIDPRHAAAWNNMGNALKETARRSEALAAYTRAVEIRPGFVDAQVNLAAALREEKRFDEAAALAFRAVQLNPRSPEAHFHLACAMFDQGKLDEAIAGYSQVLQIQPNHAEAHNALGNVFNQQKRYAEAASAYRRSLELKPDVGKIYSNLGNSLKELGRVDESIAAYQKAVQLEPDLSITYYNMASAFWAKKQYDQVIAAYRKAIELQVDFPDAWYNMGICFYEQGKLDDAAEAYKQAFALRPTFTLAYLNLGNVRKDQGLLDEALELYDRAIALEPERADIHSNRVYTIHFHPGFDRKTIYLENVEWSRRHAHPLRKFIQPHANPRDPDRRLRIGYMSPDFGMHPVGRFMSPLMQWHDHTNFEIFCYADVRSPDSLTDLLRRNSDTWRSIAGTTDAQAADLVRDDQIDILVDLAMHMTKNRMLVFARKPAPVQVTYLAYCSTTGVETIDYRLTDPYLDPPGRGDELYVERSFHLQRSYWCYDSGMPYMEVSKLPAKSSGRITFGCLNNFCKASPQTLLTWCRLLGKVPNSRFILHASGGSHRQRFIDLLNMEGIDVERVRLVSHMSLEAYFQLYHEIDIGLDPFPWPGGTTTCDALWMGVPVVSLAGETAVSRAGLSLLSNLGMPELVAQSPEQYIQIAADLAGDTARLVNLRATLREKMLRSPLMDGQAFARGVEAAYREMWRRFCLAPS